MAASPGLELSPYSINHQAILALWGCLLLSPVFHIGTARLAFAQAGLTLAAEGGEGTQAGFQFFQELGAVCSQHTAKLQSRGFRAPWSPGMGH